MRTSLPSLPILALACATVLAAQTVDDTVLKQAILFGRHGVRTPNLPNSTLDNFAVQQFPLFPDAPPDSAPATLTFTGAMNETLLGGYFRLWLTQEGVLTGNDAADSANVYFRADGVPLVMGTAQAFAAGLLPSVKTTVNTVLPPTNDPLFDPVDSGVAQLDETTAVAAVNGRLGNTPQSLSTAYSAELALLRSVLFNYPLGQTPLATPPGKIDVTAIPITVGPGNSSLPVNLGGLTVIATALDPFVMEYADGDLPLSDVAWGQLNEASISQVFRMYDRLLDLEFRTPYLAGVQASNLVSHITRSLVQVATGNPTGGAIGTPSSKVVALIGSNFNIVGVASILRLDWLLPGYQPDVAAPSGVLMFQLRQSQSTGEYFVRIAYVSQTMDQLRNRTTLTLDNPPPSAPVFVPGCSISNANFDCPLGNFVRLANSLIDPHSADTVN